MRIVIVTGMSGAGKSAALKFLEDAGYYCVDNMPVQLIMKFAELVLVPGSEIEKAALGIDVRTGHGFDEIEDILHDMKEMGISCEVLFLESDNNVLIKRYKETRRNHPLSMGDRIETGISRERERLAPIKKMADYIFDTSQMLTRDLKAEMDKIFVGNHTYKNLYVTILSFGFKYGIPTDADLVFDVRFLPNPYYQEELKRLTGNDQSVRDFVMKNREAEIFLDKLKDMLDFLIPNYIIEGKNQLVIAIGCTGGKHRSVTLANAIFEKIGSNGDYGFKLEHRDIDKDARRGQ